MNTSKTTSVKGDHYVFGNQAKASDMRLSGNLYVCGKGKSQTKIKAIARNVHAKSVYCVAIDEGVSAELLRAAMSDHGKKRSDSSPPLEGRLKKARQEREKVWVNEESVSEASENSESSESSESAETEENVSEASESSESSESSETEGPEDSHPAQTTTKETLKRSINAVRTVGQVIFCSKCGISHVNNVLNTRVDASRFEVQIRDELNKNAPPHRLTQDGVYIASRDARGKLCFKRQGEHDHRAFLAKLFE